MAVVGIAAFRTLFYAGNEGNENKQRANNDSAGSCGAGE
jgi:hypothetical protein